MLKDLANWMMVCIFINIKYLLAFWLGLEKMHALTIEPKTMKVDLWAGEEYASDEYNGFTIGDSETKYTLHLNFVGGNAGNSFSGHDNQKFSTYD